MGDPRGGVRYSEDCGWSNGSREPDYRLFEYACHEVNYAMSNSLSAARAEEKAEAAPAR